MQKSEAKIEIIFTAFCQVKFLNLNIFRKLPFLRKSKIYTTPLMHTFFVSFLPTHRFLRVVSQCVVVVVVHNISTHLSVSGRRCCFKCSFKNFRENACDCLRVSQTTEFYITFNALILRNNFSHSRFCDTASHLRRFRRALFCGWKSIT